MSKLLENELESQIEILTKKCTLLENENSKLLNDISYTKVFLAYFFFFKLYFLSEKK